MGRVLLQHFLWCGEDRHLVTVTPEKHFPRIDVHGVVESQGNDLLDLASRAQRVGSHPSLVLHRGENIRPAAILQCPVPGVREIVGVQPAPACLLRSPVTVAED